MQIAAIRQSVREEAHAHEAIGIGIRQVAKQNTEHDRADADGGADADTQGRDDAEGEARSATEAADGESAIARQSVDCRNAARVARLLAEALHSTKAEKGSSRGILRRHAPANVLLRLHRDVKRELLGLL